MRKRDFKMLMNSKSIYWKYAERYKAANYQVHRARRMLAYIALLNKVLISRSKVDLKQY